jgi:AraC-like DNA-binding protein
MFLINYLKIEKQSKNLLKIVIPVFLLIIGIRIGFVYFYSTKNTVDIAYLFEKYTSIEEIISLLFSLTIFFYTYHILSKKEKLFANILSFDNLRWIYTFFKIGGIAYLFWIIALAVTVALDFQDFIYSYYPLRILTTILIYWIGYQAIIQLRLLKERKTLRSQLQIITPNFTSEEKREEELDEEKKQQFLKVNEFVLSHKKFTETKINLESLSNDLDMSSSKLSLLIKLNAKKTFNEYINDFRIELAKELLSDKTYKNYTITSIGLESGFNSKSSFYYNFKKVVGLTPAAYQEKLSETQ